jgi:hypothetical protein
MSARRIQDNGSLTNLTVEGRETRLTLSPDSVIISRNGIEFRSPTPIAPFKEMTVSIKSPKGEGRVNCTGVVISSTGNKHFGYHISMVFTSLSKQAQAKLNSMAYSPLG